MPMLQHRPAYCNTGQPPSPQPEPSPVCQEALAHAVVQPHELLGLNNRTNYSRNTPGNPL